MNNASMSSLLNVYYFTSRALIVDAAETCKAAICLNYMLREYTYRLRSIIDSLMRCLFVCYSTCGAWSIGESN